MQQAVLSSRVYIPRPNGALRAEYWRHAHPNTDFPTGLAQISSTSVDRNDFQRLARIRLEESQALLATGYFSGSYYLGGYCVECALKACITKNIVAHVLPPKNFGNEVYTHELTRLLKLAGLDQAQQFASDPILEVNWATVKDWSEQSRYFESTEAEARELVAAVDDSTHGVLAWLIQHW